MYFTVKIVLDKIKRLILIFKYLFIKEKRNIFKLYKYNNKKMKKYKYKYNNNNKIKSSLLYLFCFVTIYKLH